MLEKVGHPRGQTHLRTLECDDDKIRTKITANLFEMLYFISYIFGVPS